MAREKDARVNDAYVVGNNAVAYDYAPERYYESREQEQPIENKKKTSINPFYTMVMMSLVFLMLMICVMMLKAQFTVANTSEQVIKYKKELTAIRRENAHLESIIHEELDLVEIRRLAMEEYGMVFPSDSDVIRIEPEATSYTVQHRTVEAVKQERASISSILAFITRGW